MNRGGIAGPSESALVQTLRWALNPPLDLLEEHQRRYGDVFRLEILGPRYRRDGSGWPMVRRTLVVFSAPEHVREVFARSGDALRAGESQEFLEWFLGPGSVMVLDGKEHTEERRELLSLFGPEQLHAFEPVIRAATATALSRWPEGRGVRLRPLVEQAVEEVNGVLLFGPRLEGLEPLLLATHRARSVFTAPVLFTPWLQVNLGRWSPGGRVAAIRKELSSVVEARSRGSTARSALGGRSEDRCLLHAVAALSAGPPSSDLLLDRLITIAGGLDNASAALAWTWHHLLHHPSVLERAQEEVRACPEWETPGPDSFLEAVCKEALRLHPPFPVVVRRVAEPVAIGGVDLAPGVFVMASMYLMHRRPELFDEPNAFRPERFLGKAQPSGGYAPFGAGVRRCLGSAMAQRQLRLVLGEVLRRFDVETEGIPDHRATRRNVTVVPADPMRVTLRRRALTGAAA